MVSQFNTRTSEYIPILDEHVLLGKIDRFVLRSMYYSVFFLEGEIRIRSISTRIRNSVRKTLRLCKRDKDQIVEQISEEATNTLDLVTAFRIYA